MSRGPERLPGVGRGASGVQGARTAFDAEVTSLARARLVAARLAVACMAAACAAVGPTTAPTRGPALEPGGGAALRGDALVDLLAVDPSIALDVRYATPNNFTGTAVYPVARCLLRRDVARRLARVQSALRASGAGLLVWDCYRPISVQQRFFALVPDPRYVAQPVFEHGRPIAGSKHNRGAAVDLTLLDARGEPLEMPTGFDDFTARAHRGDPSATPVARANAARLEAAMVEQGFIPLPTEWWHFDGPEWKAYELSDEPLDAAAPGAGAPTPDPAASRAVPRAGARTP